MLRPGIEKLKKLTFKKGLWKCSDLQLPHRSIEKHERRYIGS